MFLFKIIFCSLFLTFTFSSSSFANKKDKIDLVAEVVAKEVFTKMRIKFNKTSLKIVKKELKSQKVPQNFLKYFSCKDDLKSYKEAKDCLLNRPDKSEYDTYTTSMSEAITNLYQRGIVIFLL